MRDKKSRLVSITIKILGQTDRDGWEWGDAIARNLKAEFQDGGEEFGPVTVMCSDVEEVK